MHRERGNVGGVPSKSSEIGSIDRKRINDVLDKHLDRSSPSTSRGLSTNPKDKEFRVSAPSSSIGKTPPDFSDLNNSKDLSDGW